jgi:ubiquinone/menaquinone biosynthesis C-methylase UbiE
MATIVEQKAAPKTTGRTIHSAFLYDLLLWFVSVGGEQKFRGKALDLAELQPGESVLDVGCGTGTLAIAAKRRVGREGSVCGIDASPEMIARAEKKARKGGMEVQFKKMLAEALSFSDAQFDVVLSTVMLHHLPRKIRQQCAHEIRRVLKPGGRLLAIDFANSAGEERGSFLTWFHRHGRVNFPEVIAMLDDAGLKCVKSGPMGFGGTQFVLAEVANREAKVGSENVAGKR